MKALMLKDLRRLARWAWIPPLLSIVALGLRIASKGHEAFLLDKEFQLATLIGLPVFGLLLGFAVVWPERDGGAREVLLHRPTPRRRLAWAKWLAATLVYAIGSSIPRRRTSVIGRRASFTGT